MDEVDALCGRIGILVNGALRCLGPTMGIKARYGNGYHLDLLLTVRTEEDVLLSRDGVDGADGSLLLHARSQVS